MGLLDYLDTSRKQLGLLGDAEFPVGDIPLLGGYVLNDALRPFTDNRGDGNMLPASTTLNRIGRGMEALSPANMANAHIDAINGRTAEGEPVEGFARLMGLFPAAGAEGGGLLSDLAPLGRTPAATKGSTTLGTYAGAKSLTADKAALKTAQRMARKGADASPGGAVQQETGWFKNAGDEWQYEISDHNAKVVPHPTEPNQYRLDHPELTAAYPEVADIPIHEIAPDMPMMGWYGRGGHYPDTGEVGIRSGLTPEELRSVGLHEIGGHAVQDIEGFSGGSSPSANVPLAQQLSKAAHDDATRMLAAGEMTPDQALDWLTEQNRGLSPYSLYRRQLGEVGARDTQARMNLTPEQRRQIPPYSSENIDPADILTAINSPYRPGSSRTRASTDTALSTDRPEIPIGANVTPSPHPPPHPLIGTVYPDQFKASAAVMAAGGRNSGLKVSIQPDKTAIIEAIPGFVPSSGAGSVQGTSGWNPALASPPAKPRPQPVPSSYSMDRRGLPGRDPIGPRTQRTYRDASGAEVPLTDPEGRPLYNEAFLVGRQAPGGPDVPLPMMPDTRALANLLGTVVDDRGMILRDDARGAVKVHQPGDPTTPTRMSMRIDPNQPDDDYMASFRHEIGHMLDYSTERTEFGNKAGHQQWAIPDDIRSELEAASLKMRPDLWDKPESWWIEYRKRPDELMADAKRFYQEDPAGFKAIAPNGAAYIRAMVNDDPLLSQHIQFNAMAPAGGLLTALLHDDTERKR